jgi:hypothetical protein
LLANLTGAVVSRRQAINTSDTRPEWPTTETRNAAVGLRRDDAFKLHRAVGLRRDDAIKHVENGSRGKG